MNCQKCGKQMELETIYCDVCVCDRNRNLLVEQVRICHQIVKHGLDIGDIAMVGEASGRIAEYMGEINGTL